MYDRARARARARTRTRPAVRIIIKRYRSSAAALSLSFLLFLSLSRGSITNDRLCVSIREAAGYRHLNYFVTSLKLIENDGQLVVISLPI